MENLTIEDFGDYEIESLLASTKGKRLWMFFHVPCEHFKYFVDIQKENKADYFNTLQDAIDFYNKF